MSAAAIGLLAFGFGLYRITEASGLIDRGMSEDLLFTPEQRRKKTQRFWEVFWSSNHKVDRLIFATGAATVAIAFVAISIMAS